MKIALAEERRREVLNAAQVESWQAQRDYWLRAQMPVLDMGEAYRTATKLMNRGLGDEE
jgi:hypothetical protein